MKKKLIYLYLSVAVFAVGCQESELLQFDTSLNYVQFTSIDYVKGSTGAAQFGWVEDEMSFGLFPGETESVFNIDVEILGQASDKPIEYKISVVDDSPTTAVEGLHYKALEEVYTFPAGCYEASFPMTFYSTPDMDRKTYYLQIQVETLGNIKPGIKTKSTRTISISNKLARPDWWVYKSGALFNLIGDYSQPVYECLLTSMREEGIDVLEEDFANYTYGQWYDAALILSRYLDKNKPLDDDGNLITIKFPY